ncbi:MAG: NnrS family protein [Pseudomonadales bacterium]
MKSRTELLFSIGFRPFYLGAAVFATLAVPAWFAAYAGWMPLEPVLPGYLWHAHEMLFGFAPAVIVGFLFTAARTWTGLATPSGPALAALFGLWLGARVLMITGPAGPAIAADLLVLPLGAAALAVPLWRSRNWRNAFVVPLLLLLAGLAAAHHGAYRGWVGVQWLTRSTTTALDLLALLMAVIGGRVIPAFSANAIAGLSPRHWPALEIAALGVLGAIVLLDASGAATALPGAAARALFVSAALIHLLRLWGWQPWRTRSNRLLMVLPLGYLWLPVHLLLRGLLDAPGGSMPPPAVHALGVGAMATLMLAMMTRSALGHTGRALMAGPAETVIFIAITLAALARVAGPLLLPQAQVVWVGTSAALWTLAFALFAARYAPIVAGPRVTEP